MPKNKIQDLRDHLFETIELLKSGEINIEQAKAVSEVAQVIVNTAKVEVELIKQVGGFGTRSEFIPVEELDGEDVKRLRLVS
jgi:hypothetical protein